MRDANHPAGFDAAIAAAQGHVNARRWDAAIAALERAVAIRPRAAGAWRALGDARRAGGDPAAASIAHDRAARLSLAQPPLADAVAAIAGDRLASAEAIVRDRLRTAPTDVAAIVLLATLAQRAGQAAEALRFLRHALDIAPDHRPARERLARLLYDEHHLAEALVEFDRLLAVDPAHPGYRNLRAAILDLSGDQAGAIAAYRAMLDDDPRQPAVWMTLGNALKSTGDIPGAVAAFRRGIALAPHAGESWWGLANLKSFRFDAADIAAMEAQRARSDLADGDRIGLDFALGKAFEDEADHARSFSHYAAANRRQAARVPHDPEALGALARRSAALFTPAFLAAREGGGDPSRAPIFVVGMPRSGSTLVEQILASHPAIEGTMELPEMPRIARELGGLTNDPATDRFPDTLAALSGEQRAAIGARYLRRAALWRRTDRPFFVDKLPLNFALIGLIRLVLPHARIIDIRRHPLGCGLSVFRQYFPSGSTFATDLAHIGRFYADYAAMMAMWHERLPGHVHALAYEDLVTDTGAAVRGMLDYLDLPFDPACLAPHANRRAVRTPSAEQVRRPIHAGAIDHWRHYEPWLAPLKAALGDAPTGYAV